jgi:shikimate dehydrogenase
MLEGYSGATRVVFIVGDPIAQVKSPAGVTALMRARGRDAICVPVHVRAGDLAEFVRLAGRLPNVDGILVTVPHKLAVLPLAATLAPRARSIGAVNMLRKAGTGGWHGDMCDGEAFVAALRRAGAPLAGQRALLVGAGGAGAAIAHALVDAGVAELAVHDADTARRDALLQRLRSYGQERGRAGGAVPVRAGSDDPAGFDVACNATPMGMRDGDPLPLRVDRLAPGAVVGDVVTVPAVPPLVALARARGLAASTGNDMFEQVKLLIVDFLLETA